MRLLNPNFCSLSIDSLAFQSILNRIKRQINCKLGNRKNTRSVVLLIMREFQKYDMPLYLLTFIISNKKFIEHIPSAMTVGVQVQYFLVHSFVNLRLN